MLINDVGIVSFENFDIFDPKFVYDNCHIKIWIRNINIFVEDRTQRKIMVLIFRQSAILRSDWMSR